MAVQRGKNKLSVYASSLGILLCVNHALIKDKQMLSFPCEKHRRARVLSLFLTAVSRGPGREPGAE